MTATFPMGNPFHTTRRVEFRDTDAAGIVHFSVFFTYMEEAEHQLLRQAGLGVVSEKAGVTLSWPRVSASCDYRKAIRFEQVVNIHVSVSRIGSRSVTYRFLLTDEAQDTVAEGTTTTVCCEIPPKKGLHQTMKPIPVDIPAEFVDALSQYLTESQD